MDNTESKTERTEKMIERDHFLMFINRLASSKEDCIGVGITLNVNGTMISGQTCNPEEYFESIGRGFAEGVNRANPNYSFIDSFKKVGMTESVGNYIHLKDAQIFQDGVAPFPSAKPTGMFWRGKISEVNGFIFGNLSID